jgi:hypothetical protein
VPEALRWRYERHKYRGRERGEMNSKPMESYSKGTHFHNDIEHTTPEKDITGGLKPPFTGGF